MVLCSGITKAGNPCRRTVRVGTRFCHAHQNQKPVPDNSATPPKPNHRNKQVHQPLQTRAVRRAQNTENLPELKDMACLDLEMAANSNVREFIADNGDARCLILSLKMQKPEHVHATMQKPEPVHATCYSEQAAHYFIENITEFYKCAAQRPPQNTGTHIEWIKRNVNALISWYKIEIGPVSVFISGGDRKKLNGIVKQHFDKNTTPENPILHVHFQEEKQPQPMYVTSKSAYDQNNAGTVGMSIESCEFKQLTAKLDGSTTFTREMLAARSGEAA